jgi:hypothetical protein
MVSVLCLMALVPCDGSDVCYFQPGSCPWGYIRGNPVAFLMADVLGLVLLLLALVPCYGFCFVVDCAVSDVCYFQPGS